MEDGRSVPLKDTINLMQSLQRVLKNKITLLRLRVRVPVAAGMPYPIYYGASTVRYGNGFLLVGGEGPNGAVGAIQQWDEATSTLQPVAAGAALGTPRGGAAAVLVEAAAFPACFP